MPRTTTTSHEAGAGWSRGHRPRAPRFTHGSQVLRRKGRGETKRTVLSDFFFPPTLSKQQIPSPLVGGERCCSGSSSEGAQVEAPGQLGSGSPASLRTQRSSWHRAPWRSFDQGREVRGGTGERELPPGSGHAEARASTTGSTGSVQAQDGPSAADVLPRPSAGAGQRCRVRPDANGAALAPVRPVLQRGGEPSIWTKELSAARPVATGGRRGIHS